MVGPAELRMMAPQRQATDPDVSAWVGASAGSGKTHVLTERILRLLLAGVAPHRILCLTYTRAAAAEMANRIGRKLAGWTTAAPDEIAESLGRPATQAEVSAARRLFAQVVDAPEGLRIETIHGFCQSLLGRFPLEAGIGPHFRVIEERTTRELLAEARHVVLASAAKDRKLAAALDIVSAQVDDVAFGELMDALVQGRRRFAEALDHKGLRDPGQAIWRFLGFEAPETDRTILRAACKSAAFERSALKSAVAALALGSATDQERAEAIGAWIGAKDAERAEAFDAYASVFLTKEGEIRKKFWTKAVEKANSAAPETLRKEAERVFGVVDRRKGALVASASVALLALGAAVLREYAAAKTRASVLDYDDLIQAARRLLERPGISPWVLYKLDGIDHVLVDEAQDTSPEQWAILRALTSEFFVGLGAREAKRSIFAVGDPKQSIFSFQGADPAGFAASRDVYQEFVRSGGETFVSVPLHLSYRSTVPVLEAVDRVFAQDAARAGVDPDGAEIRHVAKRHGMAGLVELWPLFSPTKTLGAEAWALPLGAGTESDPEFDLADDIARRIRDWIGREMLPARGRTVRAGDVMVLLRHRTRFVDLLIRRLKQLRVPVAGADRMILTEQIAVQDIVSLLRFLLQPDDDLSLAEILRSPLFGMDDETLETVAAERPGLTLWRALETRRPDDPITRRLGALLARADFVAPYEFLNEILVSDGGRRRLAARLGEQAGEPIDELLALALDFERDHPPSLQGFVVWLETGGAEVKRNLEQGRDEVRILTVHGAKGLQAPIVILPDTCQTPRSQDALLWHEGLPIWTVNAEFETKVIAEAKERRKALAMAEYRRLLYVAMTRAEDRLYIGGWTNGRARSEGNWYDLMAAALKEPIAAPQEAKSVSDVATSPAVEVEVPGWAREAPAAEPVPPRPLAPSRLEGEPPTLSPLGAGKDKARFRRGQLVHRLLQSLPDCAEASRAEIGARFLERAAADLDAATRRAMLDEVLAVLGDPGTRALFAPGSRAEVGIAGQIGSRVVAGQIDRLALADDDQLLLVDYKTNREAPARAEDVPRVYLYQLAAYRACLRQVYPKRRMRCFLLWTVDTRLMEVPESLLDAHAPAA